MIIALKIHYLPVIHLSINIAKYLQLQGNDVFFLDSKNFSINYLIKKEGFSILKYNKSNNKSNIITKESDIFKLIQIREYIKNNNLLIKNLNNEYYDCLKTLKITKIDRLILFNGELDIESYVANHLGIKTWFLDDGHLENTYQMNLGGPNSKSDYNNLTIEQFLNFKYPEKQIKKIEFNITKVKINIFGYFIWVLNVLIKVFKNKFIFKRILLFKNQFTFLFIKKKIIIENIDYKKIGKYIFFPLQVNNDSQIQINSQWNDNFEILDFLTKEIKNTDYKIIIKPHPFEPQKINYNKYINNKNIFLFNGELNTLIKNSEFIITINSSVGFQAISKYKKVLILGNCFYKNSPISIYHGKNKNLINSIKLLESIKINKKLVNKYVYHFKNIIFLPGSARNQNISNLDINFFEKLYKRL